MIKMGGKEKVARAVGYAGSAAVSFISYIDMVRNIGMSQGVKTIAEYLLNHPEIKDSARQAAENLIKSSEYTSRAIGDGILLGASLTFFGVLAAHDVYYIVKNRKQSKNKEI